MEEKATPEKAPEPEPKEDWRDKRIAALTARLKAAENTPKAPDPAPDAEPKLTQADVERLANERAVALARQADFNARANAAAAEGRKAFPDFDARVKELSKIVDWNNPVERQNYNDFVEAALETGEASKIIYELGGDLNEAMRVLALPPTKRTIELAQRAIGQDPGPSSLPKPMTPVSGKNAGPSEIDPTDAVRADKLSSAEWHRRRQQQIDANAKGYDRRQVGR